MMGGHQALYYLPKTVILHFALLLHIQLLDWRVTSILLSLTTGYTGHHRGLNTGDTDILRLRPIKPS